MILQINNLTKYYGKQKGVEHVSLDLKEGEIFGLIGPYGAGKSTTIRSVMNMLNKTEGTVTFLGKPLDKNNIDLKRKIGYLPGEVYLYEDMKVSQMLDYHQSFFKENLQEKRDYLVNALQIDVNKKIEDHVQFERLGYFVVDKDSAHSSRIVYNRTCALKSN